MYGFGWRWGGLILAVFIKSLHETLYNESILVSFRSKGENTELEKTSKRCWSLRPDVTRMPPWCHNFKITLSEEPLPTYQFRFYKRTSNIRSGMLWILLPFHWCFGSTFLNQSKGRFFQRVWSIFLIAQKMCRKLSWKRFWNCVLFRVSWL